MTPPKTFRCAVYTRKSTEEGLDQEFNSLHAQQEACQAYVKSQAGEGWKLMDTPYDDGGFSGGTLERPAGLSVFSVISREASSTSSSTRWTASPARSRTSPGWSNPSSQTASRSYR